MKNTIFTFAVFAAFITLASPAYADACSNRARQMAQSMNANVISVQSSKAANGRTVCVARLKVNSPGKPSRIVTKKFRP